MDWFWSQIPRLRKVLRKRGRTAEDTEDVIQELFVRVMLYCRDGRQVRDPERFLSRTVLNLSTKLHKREHRDLYVAESIEELLIADRQFAPEESAIAAESLERLQRTLNSLDARTRDAFYLHRLHGLSYEQIADHFEVSVSAVEKYLARATIALTKEMVRDD